MGPGEVETLDRVFFPSVLQTWVSVELFGSIRMPPAWIVAGMIAISFESKSGWFVTVRVGSIG